MVRNLYRSYLYAVCIILLISATAVTAASLGLLLTRTPLRGQYDSLPGRIQIVQAIVAFVVAWLVTLTLGGLHYRLIRRDMATDPSAAGSAVRSLALNITQMIAALIAVGEAGAGISILGKPYNSPITNFSVALATSGLFALLQWERRRTRVRTSGALAMQRLHLYGAQLVLIFIATFFWFQAVQSSVLDVFISLGKYDPCAFYYLGPVCPPGTSFPVSQLIAQWSAALFVAACWAGYTAFSRRDRHSRLRQVTHLLAFGYGLSFVLRGLQGIFEAILRQVAGHPFPIMYLANGAALASASLVFGVVAMLAYRWLYAREAADLPSGMPAAGLIQLALTAAIFAYPFWVGAATLLMQVVERIVPAGSHPLAENFTQAGALFLVGLPFVFFAFLLGTRTRQSGVTWPHRVFVLVMLAAGTITTATGLVISLQALGSTLLGAAPEDWQYTARTGLITLLVGVVMAAIFATLAARNRYFAGRPEAKPTGEELATAMPQAAVSFPDTLEGILDALLAGSLSRDEAAARIRSRESTR